jgi:hypothetical protein
MAPVPVPFFPLSIICYERLEDSHENRRSMMIDESSTVDASLEAIC